MKAKTNFLCRLSFLAMMIVSASVLNTLEAQNIKLKVGGGLSGQSNGAKVVGAYKIGVGYEYEFDQRWTITPALVFYGKGWKAPDKTVPVVDDNGQPQLNEEGEQVYSLMSRSTSANYLEVPVLFSYYHRLGESRYLVFSAGPYAAVGVGGKVKTKGDGQRIGSEKLFYEYSTFGENGIRRFDAGLQAFVGYQLPAGIALGVEADFGLLRTQSNGQRNLSGLVSLSYTFD